MRCTRNSPREAARDDHRRSLSGALMAIYLARQGRQVQVFERRPDLRKVDMDAGRSINLALADRGIHALREPGVFADVEPLLIPMRVARCTRWTVP